MKKYLKILLVMAGIIALFATTLYSCDGGGNDGGTTTYTYQVVTCGTVTATAIVSIASSTVGFSPSSVTIPVNGIVEWTNNDTTYHTVTSEIFYYGFDSGTLNPGQSYCLQFTSAATYNYFCQFHWTMTGVVTVQ